MIIETFDPAICRLVLRLERKPNALHGPTACSIIVESPGNHPIRWRTYANERTCRAAAKKLTTKVPQAFGTLAEQMGGATIIDDIK